MKIKKYIAPSMPEAMKKIRAELGEQAVILSSKTIYTGGFLGLFKKKNIEVVAAIDPQSKQVPQVKEKMPVEPLPIIVRETKESLKKDAVVASASSAALEKEIRELKKMVNTLANKGTFASDSFPDELQEILFQLEKQEISEELMQSLAENLLNQWKETKGQFDSQAVQQYSEKWLTKKIEPIQQENLPFKKKYINVVGPTGVGKTTTLAKMAATTVLEEHKKIAFITTDTYRIGAIEQLKTYANLLNVPVEVAYKLSDFQAALEKFVDYDLIFIDTAGRNYREQAYVDELKKVIDFEEDMETYLVLALTAKQKDLEEIIERFSIVPIEKFIFTKLDETKSRGAMINLMCKYQKGIAYMTTGQNVPDDLVKANEEIIVKTLFGDDII